MEQARMVKEMEATYGIDYNADRNRGHGTNVGDRRGKATWRIAGVQQPALGPFQRRLQEIGSGPPVLLRCRNGSSGSV